MSRRWAAKVDSNQADIVRGLRALGITVASLASVGGGIPDLLVGWRGRNLLLELKDPSKPPSQRRLTPEQEAFFAGWRGQRAVVMTLDEALLEISGRKAANDNDRVP